MLHHGAQLTQGILKDWAKRVGAKLEEDIARTLYCLCDKHPLVMQKVFNRWDPAWVIMILKAWHSRLLNACQMTEPPPEGLLAGFTALVDRVANAETLMTKWQQHKPQPPWQCFDPVQTQSQVLSTILFSALGSGMPDHPIPVEKRKGLKPHVGDRVLFDSLTSAVDWRSSTGGASAHVAKLLAGLGLRVCLCNLYHPVPLAQTLSFPVPRLVWDNGEPKYEDGARGQSSAPVRISFVTWFAQGQKLGDGQAESTDRVIFRYSSWLGKRTWNQVEIIDYEGQTHVWDYTSSLKDEWPWCPGFVLWRVCNNVLQLEFAPQNVMKKLGKDYQYLLLSGVGLKNPLGAGPAPARNAFKKQLMDLKKAGVTIHLEFSGEPDSQEKLQELREAFSGLLRSAGINDKELYYYTSVKDCCFHRTRIGRRLKGAPEIFERYARAVFFANKLRLDRLYVHGNDVDLVFRREGSPGQLRAEILADLYAKGMVVLALLQRTYGQDWPEKAKEMHLEFPLEAFCKMFELVLELLDRDELAKEEARVLAEYGYRPARNPKEYAIAVVPVFWPKESLKEVDTSGAGDMTSALSLLYAGA